VIRSTAIFAALTCIFILSFVLEERISHYHCLAKGGDAPPLMLWAWERPENMQSIDPTTTGIACLVLTIDVKNEHVRTASRKQPFSYPKGAYVMPVVRIETDGKSGMEKNPDLTATLTRLIVDAARRPEVRSIQIDYDARVNERQFYRQLLSSVRERLPVTVDLSITALASWCLYDYWLSGLPVNEVVPMFFSMGVEDKSVKSIVSSRRHFAHRFRAIGLSMQNTDLCSLQLEKNGFISGGARRYLFSGVPWSNELVERTTVR